MNKRDFVRTGAVLVGAGLTLTCHPGMVSDAIANESDEAKAMLKKVNASGWQAVYIE
ncbi:hypothetical protein AWB65_04092 [Caballeronia humi]|uniref:Uncharacterized protein n=1 Tax=Caballeronia humi TaxID=326474 RepID=A0A158I228_9BURK|nr:hypothetical protein AWB65_04092 [Caballeronia humi]